MAKPSCPLCGGTTVLALSGDGARLYQCERATEALRRELRDLDRQRRAVLDRYRKHLRHIPATSPAVMPDLFGAA